MSTAFSTLDDRLNRVADRLTDNVVRLMTEIIISIGTAVVILTPVDTGFARANWRPSLNSPATSPISFLDPTGSATIARIETVARRFRIGDQAFLTNRAPYIGRLNEGSSPQRAAGFVQLAVIEGITEAFQKRVLTGTGLLG